MALYGDEPKVERIAISCKNCDRHIVFFRKPKGVSMIGEFFCTLKCELEYDNKQKKEGKKTGS